MRYLNASWRLGVIIVILLSLGGTGSVSASTELFSGVTTLSGGTSISASLETGTTSLLSGTSGTLVDTCTSSSFQGESNFTTSTSITMHGSTTTWGSCSFTTHTDRAGDISIEWIGGTNNGTVRGAFSQLTVTISGATCIYGTLGTHLGTLTGTLFISSFATLDVNAVINEQEPKKILCPDTTTWTASYTITSPSGLNVGP